MMTSSQLEKIRLEHEAARVFMRQYERSFQIPMRHIWHNEPRKPDVSCYLNKARLDLEIAHLYGSEEEAMLVLGRELSDETRQALQTLLQTEPDHRLLMALNTILRSKAQKVYHSERVWLVIRNANPLWTRGELLENLDRVTVPPAHPFEQIWLLGDMEGTSGIAQLYPDYI